MGPWHTQAGDGENGREDERETRQAGRSSQRAAASALPLLRPRTPIAAVLYASTATLHSLLAAGQAGSDARRIVRYGVSLDPTY